jgi:hypothetical protein
MAELKPVLKMTTPEVRRQLNEMIAFLQWTTSFKPSVVMGYVEALMIAREALDKDDKRTD